MMKKFIGLALLCVVAVLLPGTQQTDARCLDCITRPSGERFCGLTSGDGWEECTMVGNLCDTDFYCYIDSEGGGNSCYRAPGEWCPPECAVCFEGPSF